jgi:hypothetical protein
MEKIMETGHKGKATPDHLPEKTLKITTTLPLT